ncbi:MAG: hypothetical protein IIW53_04805 [Rikenellaceae bacterium]|nr:hypothetical protein [Rikenellaceae bacterium]MBQ5371456.1 hypothetical protein [Rikenellaceae bacterium]MBQ5853396.1 hypothetical protein [Rikenellaceae bacterium]
MNVIEELQEKVEAVERGLTSGEWIQQIIFDNEAYIVDMNVEDQLYEQGVNALGVSIDDYAPYSPATIEIKMQKGQPYNRVTLRDEGDFHSSFFLEVWTTQFEIKAADFKTEDLVRKYGRQILGLTDENVEELIREYILPDIQRRINETLYG